jgi:PIN domain nuclease of toxin-antitoxin system
MRLLLDTHCWLWFFLESKRLGPQTLIVLVDPANEILFSAASIWEIAIKARLGKLSLPGDPQRFVPSRMRDEHMAELPITQVHALWTYSLPLHHSDPFDRMLVAQAQLESLTIVTADRAFKPYGVPIQWADS